MPPLRSRLNLLAPPSCPAKKALSASSAAEAEAPALAGMLTHCEFSDADGDAIVFAAAPGGGAQYSVNGEFRPPFRSAFFALKEPSPCVRCDVGGVYSAL